MIGFVITALDIPIYYYLISLAFAAAVWLLLRRRVTAGRRLALALLAGYTAFILIQGIIKRVTSEEVHFALVPFWSYIAVISEGNTGLIPQMVGNVLSFMPIGFLVFAALPQPSAPASGAPEPDVRTGAPTDAPGSDEQTGAGLQPDRQLSAQAKPLSGGRLLCAVLAGFGLSCVIEVSQLVFKRGLFEFDDILHNTLGALLGALLMAALQAAWRKIAAKRSERQDAKNIV